MSKETTYQNLRNEIILLIQRRDQYQLAAYTMVTALWTLAFSQNVPWIALIPSIILVPLADKICGCGYAMESLSAYMYVCLENKEITDWEYMHFRLYEHKKSNASSKKKPLKYISRYTFTLLSLISCAIFWIIVDKPKEWQPLYINIGVAVVQLVSVLWVTVIMARKADAIKFKHDLIEEWEEAKKRETDCKE